MAVQEFPDTVESDEESDATAIDDVMRDVPNAKESFKTVEKLFQMINTPDESFPACLKGCYKEDPMFKHILDNPSNFMNFEIKDSLIFF